MADKGREGEVLAVFAKWGLDASCGHGDGGRYDARDPPWRAGGGDSEQGADR